MTGVEPPPGPEASRPVDVTELARDVDALGRAIAKIGPLTEQVTDLAKVVADLADEVAEQGKDPGKGAAPSWLGLPFTQPPPGQDQAPDLGAGAVALLDELTTWMTRVYLRYPDGGETLPQCWLWHPAIVEELVWLMCTWHGAYTGGRASAHLAGDWHDRHRPGVVRRIERYGKNCSLDKHGPGAGPAEDAEPVPCLDAATVMALWWAGDGGGQPAPTAAHFAAATARWSRNREARR